MMPSSVARLALLLVPAALTAQATPRQAGSLHSEAKTWTTPFDKGARPRDPFADQKGRVWFVGQEGNYIARLEPSTGAIRKFEIDPGTNPHNLVVDAQGTVWFTGNRNNRIVKMDPESGKITTYMIPDKA